MLRLFFREKLKFSRPITFIFSFAVVLRLLVLFLLPSSASKFAPDESTYASLALWIEQGRSASMFPVFGAGLYQSSRSFILPSSLLISFGIEPLISVRLISFLYGLLSLSFFYFILNYLARMTWVENTSFGVLRKRKIFFFTIYAFFPSNLLWSTLGLREAAVQFWLILIIYLVIRIQVFLRFEEQKLKYVHLNICVVLALTLGFGTRPETFVVICCSLMLSSVLLRNFKRAAIFIGAVSIGLLGGMLFVSDNSTNDSANREKVSQIESAPNNTIQSKIGSVMDSEGVANGNRIGAASALPARDCNNSQTGFRKWTCITRELPLRLVAVLLRPFPLIDNGSSSLLFASWENIIWLTLFFAIAREAYLLRREILTDSILLFLFLFVSFYSMGMAMFEGNLGTAFRHKATILPFLIVLLFRLIMIRLPKKPNEKNYST